MVMLGARLEPVIKANNAIDVYEEYFPDKPPEPGSDAPGKPRLAMSRFERPPVTFAHMDVSTAIEDTVRLNAGPKQQSCPLTYTLFIRWRLDHSCAMLSMMERHAGLATMTVLRDAASAGRAAQYLCWHPDQSRRLAVAHATMVPALQIAFHTHACGAACGMTGSQYSVP